MPLVGIIMGSDSDLKIMKDAGEILDKFAISYEYSICSAHRLPFETAAFATQAKENGIKVIIAGAGGAAHLPGVIAAYTTLPVIGVPIQTSALGGVDSLYSIVQMPKGIPVATVGINGSANAALLAAQILAIGDESVEKRIAEYRINMAEEVKLKDRKLKAVGVTAYLQNKEG